MLVGMTISGQLSEGLLMRVGYCIILQMCNSLILIFANKCFMIKEEQLFEIHRRQGRIQIMAFE